MNLKNIKEVKRHIVDGELVPVQNTIYVNPNKIVIDWYDVNGNLIDDKYDGRVPTHMWMANIDGVNPKSIVSIEYPPLTYDGNGDYMVKVVYTVYEE